MLNEIGVSKLTICFKKIENIQNSKNLRFVKFYEKLKKLIKQVCKESGNEFK